ncbi:MAG TPA: hypothetical protein VK116_14070, partial [Planctomycetota bacterium]|nr:hypothetical protein [Planctomycetota bacterium]
EAPAAEREESSHTATAVAEEEPPRELERDAHRVAPRGEARPQPRTELTTSSPAPASTSPEPAPQNETPQPSAGKPGSVFVRLRNLLGRKKA